MVLIGKLSRMIVMKNALNTRKQDCSWRKNWTFECGGAKRALSSFLAIILAMTVMLSAPAWGQQKSEEAAVEPDHIRGQIMAVEDSTIVIRTPNGGSVRLGVPENLTIFRLSEAKFTEVDFGTYVGSVSVRLDAFSPIVRDSMSWLHEGYELRIIDEDLRGIAVGHRDWSLTDETVMTHGWVDDLEIRVLSIKYGPTEEEETDVDVPRDVPILKMSLGDRSLIKSGVQIFAGAHKGDDGNYAAAFVFVADDGMALSM